MGTSARAQGRAPFPYRENGWTDSSEIWYVVRDLLARPLTHTNGGEHLNVHMCVPFPIWHAIHNPGRLEELCLNLLYGWRVHQLCVLYKLSMGYLLSACAQSQGSRKHSAEMWCVVRPINHES